MKSCGILCEAPCLLMILLDGTATASPPCINHHLHPVRYLQNIRCRSLGLRGHRRQQAACRPFEQAVVQRVKGLLAQLLHLQALRLLLQQP